MSRKSIGQMRPKTCELYLHSVSFRFTKISCFFMGITLKFLMPVETGRKTLILLGTKTSNVLNQVQPGIYHLKKDSALRFSWKDKGIKPFECGGETSLDFFSLKTDCILFVVSWNCSYLRYQFSYFSSLSLLNFFLYMPECYRLWLVL